MGTQRTLSPTAFGSLTAIAGSTHLHVGATLAHLMAGESLTLTAGSPGGGYFKAAARSRRIH